MKTESKKTIKLATFSDLTRPVQETELKKTTKKSNNLIFYKKPKDTKHSLYMKDKDKNGKRIWINFDAWSNPINIKESKDIKLLPKEIQKFIPKWEQKIERLIKEHKFDSLYIDYKYADPHLQFIIKRLIKEHKFDSLYIGDYRCRYADPYLQFIYENKVYFIYPQAFKNIQKKNAFYIPYSVSYITIKDLESIGCFYSYIREPEIV